MLFIASDHAGFARKEQIKAYLNKKGIEFEDLGAKNLDPTDDFPVYAKKLCKSVLKDEQNKGILICGSGIGMSICANRFKGIKAGLVLKPKFARLARQHNDINVVVIAGRFCSKFDANKFVDAFLNTKALGEKYEKRMKMIDE